MSSPVTIDHYSDVLCVWAYIAQVRLDELRSNFGDKVAFNYHFIPLFGCTEHRIKEGWKDRGGFEGFNRHVIEVCETFPHVEINSEIWKSVRPRSSAATHHFIKAVQLMERSGEIDNRYQDAFDGRTVFEEFVWKVRLAFFKNGWDVSDRRVLENIADELSISLQGIFRTMDNGEAIAALCRDAEQREKLRIEGSPTYLLNEGRQKLYGNVGYKILEANVNELLNNDISHHASWC